MSDKLTQEEQVIDYLGEERATKGFNLSLDAISLIMKGYGLPPAMDTKGLNEGQLIEASEEVADAIEALDDRDVVAAFNTCRYTADRLNLLAEALAYETLQRKINPFGGNGGAS